jgi:hypothetical protein
MGIIENGLAGDRGVPFSTKGAIIGAVDTLLRLKGQETRDYLPASKQETNCC